jgi:hypothetical protein
VLGLETVKPAYPEIDPAMRQGSTESLDGTVSGTPGHSQTASAQATSVGDRAARWGEPICMAGSGEAHTESRRLRCGRRLEAKTCVALARAIGVYPEKHDCYQSVNF